MYAWCACPRPGVLVPVVCEQGLLPHQLLDRLKVKDCRIVTELKKWHPVEAKVPCDNVEDTKVRETHQVNRLVDLAAEKRTQLRLFLRATRKDTRQACCQQPAEWLIIATCSSVFGWNTGRYFYLACTKGVVTPAT